MQADILRKKFLDFFKSKGHRIVESDSLIPKDDPTVLFTPAGMNQFKREFMGFDSGFKRAASSQRCLRTDDLEKVGRTSVHHTFFEMLGNFSFGDYFKSEAIAWAWGFLTGELKIDAEKLWVSVYKDDDEAYNIWKDKIKVPGHKIIKFGDKENFWPSEAKEKGPNGPCGPCSEIFFDFGAEVGCGKKDCSPACSCGRFAEIWNLVFTQFNRKENGVLEPLPSKNIDTGMGLERLAAVMQGKLNNFETELFQPLIKEITAAATKEAKKPVFFAISDHIRAVVFSIYDGVLPSNEARGYVVRKLIRKSSLHLRNLGITKPFLYKLVPVLAEIMKDPYPELIGRRENIAEIILAEEKNFIATLNSSEQLFKDAGFLKTDPVGTGSKVFQLYDTYGIPLELTKNYLDKHGIEFSRESFDKELERQKARSKSQSAMKGDVFSAGHVDIGVKETRFSGYKDCQSAAKILKIFKGGTAVKKISEGDVAELVLDKTPFYPESGGQVADTGQIVKGKSVFLVKDTKKTGKVIVHIGKLEKGSLKVTDAVKANIDVNRRLAIARNHTATHLLQAALRKVLGPHVMQQGSLVAEDRLRFDFTHFKDISQEELDRVEETVNASILDNVSLEVKKMALSEAKKKGALAFFGEKYENDVRVVDIGGFSKELCGGTHLHSTGQIGMFRLIHEGSVAQGVRRIEAVTGKEAFRLAKQDEDTISELTAMLKTTRGRLKEELQKRFGRIKELEKEMASKRSKDVESATNDIMRKAELINGIKVFIGRYEDGFPMAALRRAADIIRQGAKSSIAVLGTVQDEGNVSLVVGVSGDLCQQGIDASVLIKQIAVEIDGSGGGRKDFAQAGGKNPAGLEKAFKKLRELIAKEKESL